MFLDLVDTKIAMTKNLEHFLNTLSLHFRMDSHFLENMLLMSTNICALFHTVYTHSEDNLSAPSPPMVYLTGYFRQSILTALEVKQRSDPNMGCFQISVTSHKVEVSIWIRHNEAWSGMVISSSEYYQISSFQYLYATFTTQFDLHGCLLI